MTLEIDHLLKLQYLIKNYSPVKGLMWKPLIKRCFVESEYNVCSQIILVNFETLGLFQQGHAVSILGLCSEKSRSTGQLHKTD